MTRTLITVMAIFISTMINGQNATFDKKVQQLFFNVDVSIHSTSIIKKFADVKELTYKKPSGYVDYPFTGNTWMHTFKFTTHRYLTNHFDTGIIELKVVENSKRKKVSSIWWELQFDKVENAKKVFDEMKNYFRQTKAINKIYSADIAIETAEFTDKASQKYPYISFTLFDNSSLDKKYKIIFLLDNDMHYEKE